jgi:phospholipid/cholesterol/gamma-HCH transport system substrate-binding protein
MTTNRRKHGVIAVLATVSVWCSGCEWRGLNSLPMPGTEGDGPGAYQIQAQLPDVSYLEENSRVRVSDVNVGTVTKIERQGWHALVTIRLNRDVDLPANATARVAQTSLLGSLHVELAPPGSASPQGKLHNGSLIALDAAGSAPSTEQTLSAVSMLLNGGGIGQVQDITHSFRTALNGREQDLRSLIGRIDEFTGKLNAQTGDIVSATDSLNRLSGRLAAQKPVVDRALKTIPDALDVVAKQRNQLVEAADKFGQFQALVADSANQTKDALVRELNDLAPVVKSLADAGPALTRSLSLLATFPWPKETLSNWVRGDYANLSLIVDLTLSRIDSSFFTGTRWEGNLTELEMQWGRTIGQMPSPYTAGNPLVAPYRADQGR